MTRADLVLLLASLLSLPFVYLHYWQPASPGGTVRILRGETLVRELPLDRDQEIEVEGSLGVSHLRIHDGKIRFTDSPCRGKVCIQRGWLGHGGDFNACLPNGISIEIPGNGGFDSINF